jgi:hypothetical protein
MFDRKNFTVLFLNQSKAPSEYGYVTDETIATVLDVGYFNDLYDILKVNDLIKVTAAANTASPVISYVRVSANAAKVVTVVDGTDLV